MSAYSSPEVKIARRIVQKHSILPPIDVQSLVKIYADLVFKSFPINGIDGIAINIKVPGKRPLIVINSDISFTRQRFTMAHELAHLVIPWHTGIKFDDAQLQSKEAQAYSELMYSNLEAEANAFAAELLMPSITLREIAEQNSNLAAAHKEICRQLQVSPEAAAIKMGQTLPPGIIYCVVKNGIVQNSGRTEATPTIQPNWGEPLSKNLYPSFQLSEWSSSGVEYYWWQSTFKFSPIEPDDDRTWRVLLDEMLLDVFPSSEIKNYKYKINGIIGSANGKLKGTSDYSLENLYSYCYLRFDDSDLKYLKKRKNFPVFLRKRLEDMMNK